MNFKYYIVLFLFVVSSFAVAKEPHKISLNGYWDIEIGDMEPENYGHKVQVPGIASMAVPLFNFDLHGNIPPMEIGGNYVWYKTEFTLDKDVSKNVILKIRAKYNAQVFLNGVDLGYDHHTTYSHGEFDASKAINFMGINTIVVRVGNWNTASSPSKENETQFWRNSRCPGIWDDVELRLSNGPIIEHVQILPNLKTNTALANITLVNPEPTAQKGKLKCVVVEKVSGKNVSKEILVPYSIAPNSKVTRSVKIPCSNIQYWTAGKEGNPFLYVLQSSVIAQKGVVGDSEHTSFGFRTFEIDGADILINGEKSFLRSENIAFSRALIRWDHLLFNDEWIRNFLIALKDDYNLNYIRSHICHMPDNWYTIADEVGLMIHDEWRYFHDSDPQGSDLKEAEIELTRWVKQNLNHPSIVVWDNENEGDVVLPTLLPELRKLDPTRPWGEEDFDALHVYDYSENVTDSIVDQLDPNKPCTRLELCRLWTNEFGWPEPRENFKTVKTATGWGFKYYTSEDILQLQADIHADLGNFYRSRRFHSWAPFAVLSSDVNAQNYFMGDIGESLSPKPCFLVLRDVNEPFGLSVEMLQAKEWYKDKLLYSPKAVYQKGVNIWNDFAAEKRGMVRCWLVDEHNTVFVDTCFSVLVPAWQNIQETISIEIPEKEGIYYLNSSLTHDDGYVSNGPVRRFMVARQLTDDLEGLQGFGGRHKPANGAVYFASAYTRTEVPASVRDAIQRELGDSPISSFIVKLMNDSVVFDMTAEWREKRTYLIMDINGVVKSKIEKDRLKEQDLPLEIREGLIRVLGFAPVDEVKISVFKENGQLYYYIDTKVGKNDVEIKLDHTGNIIGD